ncbi:hypothetical protein ACA910_002267 [Epithemia clementina (nom. ined.)]
MQSSSDIVESSPPEAPHNASLSERVHQRTSTTSNTNLCHRAKVLWSQLSLHELSGSAGDLGTFIPLFVALGRDRSIYVAPALFLAGLSNVLTGFLWDVPMPVQPMKTIAALAIAQGLTRNQVTASGMWMGIFMVALGATSGIEWVNRIVPKSVVAGVQLGVGISLAIHGIVMILPLPFWIWEDPDSSLMAILAGLGTVYCLRPQPDDRNSSVVSPLPLPVGLYLLLLAAVVGVIKYFMGGFSDSTSTEEGWSWEPVLTWTLFDISFHDWVVGFWEGAIPQLPLTTLNSVISVCALAHTLFPEKRHDSQTDLEAEEGMAGECLDSVLSRREVAFSVGIMNLLACPFGGLPNCHGAGGLAGQHKLGARHGAAIVFLGSMKMILALTLGAAVMHMLDAFPLSVLGIMLTMAGHELASTGLKLSLQSVQHDHNDNNSREYQSTGSVTSSCSQGESTSVVSPEHSAASAAHKKLELRDRMSVALLTAIVILGTHKTHYGALAGWVADFMYKASRGTFRFSSFCRRSYVEVRSIEIQPESAPLAAPAC